MPASVEDIRELIPHPADCQLWVGGKFTQGYGSVRIGSKNLKAHRFSYMCHKGDIPKDLCVRHTCDTPSCINPNHLELGTHKDNMQDMHDRGRYRGGSKNRLSEEQVTELVSKYSHKYGQLTQLGKEYNISYETVSKYLKEAGITPKVNRRNYGKAK